MFLLFISTYALEKFHVLFTYQLFLDPTKPLLRALTLYPLYSLLIFQTLMFSILGTVLNRRVSVYLFAALALEVLIVVCAFEFMRRKPWEGREKKIDKVMEEQ
jgi:hypothetical protein